MESAPSRRVLLGTLATLALPAAGCLDRPSLETVSVEAGFEADMEGWTRAADVPQDPNTGAPVAWSIERTTARSRSGSASLEYTLDGRQDNGTIWIERPVAVDPGTAYDGSLSVWSWSDTESFNTLAHLVLLVGPNRPKAEGDFPRPGETMVGGGRTTAGLRLPLNRTAGWDEYAVEWATPALDVDRLWLAVGISVVWETEVTYLVDDLALALRPR